MSPLGKPSRAAAAAGLGSGRLPWNSASTSIELGVVDHLALAIQRLEFRFDRAGREDHLGVEHALAGGGERGLRSSGRPRVRARASTICQVPRIETSRPARAARAGKRGQRDRAHAERSRCDHAGESGSLRARGRAQAGGAQAIRSAAAAGIGRRTVSSMHQQVPSALALPHSNATPQRAQASWRSGNGASRNHRGIIGRHRRQDQSCRRDLIAADGLRSQSCFHGNFFHAAKGHGRCRAQYL